MRHVIAALLALGCAPAGSAPLVCDPAREGELAFLYHVSEGFEAVPYLPHGRELLVVDGSCRYFVTGGPTGTLLTGTLTSEELAALNDEILTFPWQTVDGVEQNFGAGADGWTITLRRGEQVAQCYSHCRGHDALPALAVASSGWRARLVGPGATVEGPVLVDVLRLEPPPSVEAIEWTGTPLSAGGRILVDDPADVAALRALREGQRTTCCGPPIHVREGDVVLGIGVVDVLPIEVELFTDHPGRPLHG